MVEDSAAMKKEIADLKKADNKKEKEDHEGHSDEDVDENAECLLLHIPRALHEYILQILTPHFVEDDHADLNYFLNNSPLKSKHFTLLEFKKDCGNEIEVKHIAIR